MKKLLAIIMATALIFSLVAVSASAAGTYGEYEKKLIDVLSTDAELKIDGKDATIHIPDNYVNQAKNYFAGTAGDITEQQYEEIVSYINAGKEKVIATVEADHALVMKNGEVDIAHMPTDVKSFVLEQGQKACAVVGLTLRYTGGSVIITDATGAEVFNDDAIIKTTGADMTSVFVTAGVMLALVAAAFVTAKKVKLF